MVRCDQLDRQRSGLNVRDIGHNEWYIVTKIKKGVTVMYSIRYVLGHVQVYDCRGNFLFSADNEREAREELEYYEEFAA